MHDDHHSAGIGRPGLGIAFRPAAHLLGFAGLPIAFFGVRGRDTVAVTRGGSPVTTTVHGDGVSQ